MGMDNKIVFSMISTFRRCLAATCLLDSYLGLLQHGRAVASDAVQGLQNWDCCSLSEGGGSSSRHTSLPGHRV